jgi:hypothetical protein
MVTEALDLSFEEPGKKLRLLDDIDAALDVLQRRFEQLG